MESLQVRPVELNHIKAKAIEDARQMQASVIEAATKAGKEPPKYALLELIGKGTFGRVYKGKDMTSAAIVAVKIIDIDESDTLNPRNADSYSEFLKEVNALKLLSESKARNINHVVEALPVGKAMWMITEYCGGGSVATLMKPTAPGGLQEKWIIPILREVAEAIGWVHRAGIIHRDIKCANVLITEEGAVQLCDFGVAGTIETKIDKRTTIIGTPHWMAPELFDPNPSYGKEVDIWAFGSMVFEIATGLPPNVAKGIISYERIGPYLKQHVPRLEGGNYSNELRSLVAFCLEEQPSARPTIEQVQKHPYIYNTSQRYPTSSLSQLVKAFKAWEDHGGARKSLFMMGGAPALSEATPSVPFDDAWNFSTTAAFDQEVYNVNAQDVYDAYGNHIELDANFAQETSRPNPPKSSRRRPPPEALAPLRAPLEKIFDPNTLSSYEENSRSHYGRQAPLPTSDLPLRDDSAQTSIRDTMIDLGDHDTATGLSSFADMDTIRPERRGRDDHFHDNSSVQDFNRPPLSDPADVTNNRRTQDWKFPAMVPPASADPELSRFPSSYEPLQPPSMSGFGDSHPIPTHHPTESSSSVFSNMHMMQSSSTRPDSMASMIDLDAALGPTPTIRPSTANSDVGSTTSEHTTSGNPFEFERHVSMYQPAPISQGDSYQEFDSDGPSQFPTISGPNNLHDVSDFSASDAEGPGGAYTNDYGSSAQYDTSGAEYTSAQSQPRTAQMIPPNQRYTFDHFPPLQPPPSSSVMSNKATKEDFQDEMTRLLNGMDSQLRAFRSVYENIPVTKGTPYRNERRDEDSAA
ncbi:kinase-like domain-containing protein [Xylogone sp. PMI_703]|nr:kinase-like domain-containing protein [Xylogone sp. PMI_703]